MEAQFQSMLNEIVQAKTERVQPHSPMMSKKPETANFSDLPTMLQNLSDPNAEPNSFLQLDRPTAMLSAKSKDLPTPNFRSADFDFSKFLRNYQCRKQSSRQRNHFLEITLLENCSWTSKYPIRNVYEDYDCKTRLLRLGAYKPCIYNGTMMKYVSVQKYVNAKYPLDLQAIIVLPSETNVDMLLSMDLHLEIVCGNDYTFNLAREKFPIDPVYVKLYKSLEKQIVFLDNKPFLQLKKNTKNQAEIWAIIENYQNVTFLTGRKTNTTHEQVGVEKYCEFGSISGKSNQYSEPISSHNGSKKYCSFKFKCRETDLYEFVPFISKHACSIEEDLQVTKRRCRSDIMYYVRELFLEQEQNNENNLGGISIEFSPEHLLNLVNERFPNLGDWAPSLQVMKNLSAMSKQVRKRTTNQHSLEQKRNLEIQQMIQDKNNFELNFSTGNFPTNSASANDLPSLLNGGTMLQLVDDESEQSQEMMEPQRNSVVQQVNSSNPVLQNFNNLLASISPKSRDSDFISSTTSLKRTLEDRENGVPSKVIKIEKSEHQNFIENLQELINNQKTNETETNVTSGLNSPSISSCLSIIESPEKSENPSKSKPEETSQETLNPPEETSNPNSSNSTQNNNPLSNNTNGSILNTLANLSKIQPISNCPSQNLSQNPHLASLASINSNCNSNSTSSRLDSGILSSNLHSERASSSNSSSGIENGLSDNPIQVQSSSSTAGTSGGHTTPNPIPSNSSGSGSGNGSASGLTPTTILNVNASSSHNKKLICNKLQPISKKPMFMNKSDFNVQTDIRESMEFSIKFNGSTWKGILFKE